MNLKKTDYTISNEKFQFCVADLKIVDFVYNLNDRFFKTTKMIKILKWFSYRNVSEVCAFIEVCVYYKIWIMNFVIIIVFIYRLLKNGKSFVWRKKQKIIMNILKLTLMIASALKSLNYFFLINEIILTINFNLKKWNVIFSQINFEIDKRYFFWYKSELWIKSKFYYNAIKRECRDLLKTLKKVRFWLYEMWFIIKIDVNILMTQFNRFAADLLKILIIRWLTWIKLFDFDVKHVFDKKYTIANNLSRQFRDFLNDIDEIHEKNINDFIDKQLNCVRVCSVNVNEVKKELSLKKNYFKKSQRIVKYLIILI